MTTIHAEIRDERAILPLKEFERLMELARLSEAVEVLDTSAEACGEDEMTNREWLQLAQDGGAFDWLADEPDLYSEADLKVRY
jgi:flagellar motility protein MotE (MotC chaperone)